MKKLLAIALLALPMIAAPIVTYTTSGVFSAGTTPGTSVFTAPNGNLSYLAGGGTADFGPFNPTNGNFGVLDSNAVTGPVNLSGTLTITINQTGGDFGTGMGTLTGTLAGGIAPASSNAFITFSGAGASTSINGVVYAIPGSFLIVPPSQNLGRTSLQGTVTAPGVPEPGTLGLIGLGLASVGFIARRRRA